MKASLTSRSVGYTLDGEDETGLIPSGAVHALVRYGKEGQIESVFYMPEHQGSEATMEQLRAQQRKADELNRRYLSPDEMKKVVGLLEKLSTSQR